MKRRIMITIRHLVTVYRVQLLGAILLLPAILTIIHVRSTTAVMPGTTQYLPLILSPSAWQVASPDGTISVTVAQRSMPAPYPAAQRLYYTVAREGVPVLEYSPLGLTMAGNGGDFVDGLTFVGSERRSIDETYRLVTGKRSRVVHRANELVLRFRNRAGRDLELVVRAYDDGAAYRYRFPGSGNYAVTEELSGFRLPAGTTAWAQEWINNYEEEYYRRTLDLLDDAERHWGHPILLELPGNGWALLAEAAVAGDYAVLHFRGSGGDRLLRLNFPPDQTEPITGSLPLATPWRVVMAGPTLGTLVESDMMTNLNPPSRLDDTAWIKPGRVAWSWWANTRSPGDLAIQQEYVDFAQEMGWEYVLVDEGWDADWVPELVEYADQRDVDIILWSFARDFNETRARQWAEWGVKGAKLDFIDSDRQAALQEFYDPFYELTARYKLMLNFHGATKPAGAHRTWPHYLTREAVRGAEYRDLESYENIALVFTRNIIGPMDYTPVVLSRPKGKWTTTFANQVAQAVLFESGWQHFPDKPEHYRNSPAKPFLQAVPTTWDDTRFIDGYPNRLAVLARRKGVEWYIGANGFTAGDIRIPLNFLDATAAYQATIYRDGDTDTDIVVETRTVTSSDTLTIYLRQNGGCAIRLVPVVMH
jgi:alpha-glucosidase